MLAALPSAARAQMHHVDKPERVTRAIGVYEWTGDLSKPKAARFVPVSLFIEGHMEDAGLYLARPVPFALQTGDVYALERSGQPQGLLDLDYAQHVVTSQALADDEPAGAWYGYGKFTPEAAPRITPLHASSHIPVIQSNGKAPAASTTDDTPPHMTRRGSSSPSTTSSTGGTGTTGTGSSTPDSGASKTPPSTTSTDSPASQSGGTGSGSTSSNSDDTDRPTLRHRDPSQDAARRREYGTKSKQASVTAVGPAPGDDPDRPTLGRGTAEDNGIPPLTGLPVDLHQAVAVSDPKETDHHDFAREWDTPAERALTQAALEAAARPRMLAYLSKNGLVPAAGPLPPEAPTPAETQASTPATNSTSTKSTADASAGEGEGAPPKLERGVPTTYGAKPAPATAATGTSATAPTPGTAAATSAVAAPPPEPKPGHTPAHTATHRNARMAGPSAPAPLTLAQEQVAGFTLSYGGLPTFVYTAAAPVALAKPTPAPAMAGGVPPPVSPGTAHPAVYVTVVAQRLPSGDLQVALANVTDSLHLDRGPRLRLIDAVDPDDSHRADLLFELRGASSRQFALYRLTAAQAERTFTTASIE